MAEEIKKDQVGYQFGTFKGVFIPNILTILGVVMYLRFGWVLAHAGLFETLFIVTISTIITLLTSFSISQLATNSKVGVGGAYYIISRSLGVQAGGAIGIPLFLGQAFSIAFYVIGFSESIGSLFPHIPIKMLAVITLFILMVIAFLSANLALKIQFIIFLTILLSLISIFMGSVSNLSQSTLEAPPFVKEHFWKVFAIFFPAVTGILSGLSMSGDLKSPTKSIPLGTIGSVLVSFIVYLSIPLFLNHLQVSRESLNANPLILMDVARWKLLVLIGLWGATLSSAVGSILGAPRTLQSLARDKIVFSFLGRSYGVNKEPHIALLLSCMIAFCSILIGNLDMIASVLTMFFLTTYGLLNFSAAMEGIINNPSWRPGFKIHWSFPLAGSIGCLMVMLLINSGATMIATFISGGIYFLMHQKKLNAYWGDMKYAMLSLITRFCLYKAMKIKVREKSWRPNILVLSGSPSSRWHLIHLADALSHGKGFLTVASLLTSDISDQIRIENMRKSMEIYLNDRAIPAMVRVQRVEGDVLDGARHMIEYFGFGPLVPNTVLLGMSEKEENRLKYADLLMTTARKKKNLILVHEGEDIDEVKNLKIDIWWRRGGKNAGLMLALGYLLMTSPEWQGATLTLKTIINADEDPNQQKEQMKSFLKKANVNAEIDVLLGNVKTPIFLTMKESSKNSGLVFLGLKEPDIDETIDQYASYYAGMKSNLEGFPAVVLVLASEDIDFQKIFELHESTF